MTSRTIDRTVTFRRSFILSSADGPYPPGEYLVQTDEEMIEQLSFPAWRRVATMIHVRRGGATQVLTITPQELDLILSRDAEDAPRSGEVSERAAHFLR
jgi:hypothetical protein